MYASMRSLTQSASNALRHGSQFYLQITQCLPFVLDYSIILTLVDKLLLEFKIKCLEILETIVKSKWLSTRYSQPWITGRIKCVTWRHISSSQSQANKFHDWSRYRTITSVQAATTDCVNSDVSGGRWTPNSLATLVYVVVNLRINYCNTVLAGAPRTVTNKLQRVLNAAARVITDTWKFDRGLGQILHDELHWLEVPDRVFFKLAVTVHRCLNSRATPYLSDYCFRPPVSTLGSSVFLVGHFILVIVFI